MLCCAPSLLGMDFWKLNILTLLFKEYYSQLLYNEQGPDDGDGNAEMK